MNKILAYYPDLKNKIILWELPKQGIYLGYANSVNLIRICSKVEFELKQYILVNQGWILN
jgi:hypothetical protein